MTERTRNDADVRGAGRLLVDPRFGSFFAARLFTSIGIWLHGVVAAIAAFAASESAVAVAVVSLVQFTPQLLLAPLSGALADRGGVKRQMLLGRILSGIGSTGLAAWLWLVDSGTGWAGVAPIAVSSLVVGLGLVTGGPAMQSAVPLLVEHDELPAGMALNTAPITVGRIAGPALGAVTAASLGLEAAFLLAGVTHLLFIALIARIHFPPPEGRRSTDTFTIREAVRWVRHDRPTLLVLVGITALGCASEPTLTLAPPLGSALGGGTALVGALATSMGVGAALGIVASSTLATRLPHDRTAILGMGLMAAALATCAAPLTTSAALTAFAVAGFGFIVAVSSLSTILQMRLPPLLRGRIMALWLMGFVGSRPLGAVLVGLIADTAGLPWAFGAAAAILAVAMVACRPARMRDDD